MLRLEKEEVALFLRNSLLKTQRLRDETTVIVVASVKGKTVTDDYDQYSVITDFFSEEEMEEIITAFRDFGFYVEAFIDEADFIQAMVENRLHFMPKKRTIVYNTCQKGTGPARQSLVPAFCKLFGIPYIGSNAYVSSACRHKYHFNSLLRSHHSHLPKSWLFDHRSGWLLGCSPPEGMKVILKPVYEAASIGITNDSVFVYSHRSDNVLKEHSRILRQPLAVEQFIGGYEVEVPLIISGERFFGLGPVGISVDKGRNLGNGILTYNEVYDDLYEFYEFQEFEDPVIRSILQCAQDSARVLGIEDYGRIDFRIADDGEFYLTDISTNPHTVIHSSCNFIFNILGFNHSELLTSLVSMAARRYEWI